MKKIERVERDPLKHCWHNLRQEKEGPAVIFTQVCCSCGAITKLLSVDTLVPIPEHGTYATQHKLVPKSRSLTRVPIDEDATCANANYFTP